MPRTIVEQYDYEVGKKWLEPTLVSPIDFALLKTEEQFEKEKKQIESFAPEVFLLNPDLKDQYRSRIIEFLDKLNKLLRLLPNTNAEINEQLELALKNLEPSFTRSEIQALANQKVNTEALKGTILQVFDKLYAKPYINRKSQDIHSQYISIRSIPQRETIVDKSEVVDLVGAQKIIEEGAKSFTQSNIRVLVEAALRYHAKPNYLFNRELYEEDLNAALGSLSRAYDKVPKGDTIVKTGEYVNERIARKIYSLVMEQQRLSQTNDKDLWFKLLGQAIMMGLLTLVTILYLRYNRNQFYQRNRKFTLLFLIYLVMTAIIVLVYKSDKFSNLADITVLYVIPLTIAPIIITVFFDDRVGFFTNILLAFLTSLVFNNSFGYFFIQVTAGSVAVYKVAYLRKRSQFFEAAGLLLLVYGVAYMGYSLYLKGDFTKIQYFNLLLIILNVAFTLSAYPIIYLFEKLFKITSDFTFLELKDSNHPLLTKMADIAPGTYQHSLQVANICEEIARKINANALQVYVGALFHDIGKLQNPEHFTENQKTNQSPHDNLPALASASIIIKHVEDGLRMAEEAKLPIEVRQFIESHHGTEKTKYFYHHYLNEHPEQANNPEVEQWFRYPGPLPSSREMALLMIIDSSEAASHALDNPSTEDITQMVRKIIKSKIDDNQFVNAALTFKDLHTIEQEAIRLLVSIHHTRVKYPDPPLEQVKI